MGGFRGLSTTVILLTVGVFLSSLVAAEPDPDSSALLGGSRVVDGLAVGDFEDGDEEALAGEDELKRAAFRTDLGKRDHDDDKTPVSRVSRAGSRWRTFKTDLGKRRGGFGSSMFRSDLGRRSAWPRQTAAAAERRRAMFRSDLGKRVPDSYTRRMFRTDLGKRQMFRHDLG